MAKTSKSKRSAAARKAWATRRKMGWKPKAKARLRRSQPRFTCK